MTTKKNCINFPTHFYTGKEQSPLHYGLSAEGYDINSVMDGYDKQSWVVEIKNNKKVWIRKDSILKITPEEPVIISNVCENNLLEPVEIKPKAKPVNKPTDYNIFVKYRLNELKDINKNSKGNFDNVRAEWQELKKNPEKLKEVIEKAKIWLLGVLPES
jgi:hypothetical protein